MIKRTRPSFHDRTLSSPHLLHTKPNLQLLILHESPPRMAEMPISFTRAVRRFWTCYWSCSAIKLTHWLLKPRRWYCSWMLLVRKTWNSHKKQWEIINQNYYHLLELWLFYPNYIRMNHEHFLGFNFLTKYLHMYIVCRSDWMTLKCYVRFMSTEKFLQLVYHYMSKFLLK